MSHMKAVVAKHHFAIIADTVPHCMHGGGGITAYAAARAIRDRGHDVTVIALTPCHYTGGMSEESHVTHLEGLGIRVDRLEGSFDLSRRSIWKRLAPAYTDLLPGFSMRAELRPRLEKERVHGILMYHWNALAALHHIHIAPKIGLVGDPLHLPHLFRREFLRRNSELESLVGIIKRLAHNALIAPKQIAVMKTLLRDCDIGGAFAAHHAVMLSDLGGRECQYFRTPTPDPLPSSFQPEEPSEFRLLHIGHLQGIATLSGIEILADEMIPSLAAGFPKNGFKIHLVGAGFETMPENLRRKLTQSCVTVRGQVSPPDREFLEAHCVIVPTPIDLGIRVRILTAFSFGSCVVAHVANRCGIPELEHGHNCLLGSSGQELANLCREVALNLDLRTRLAKNARQTFEQSFSPSVAGGHICDALERLSNS